MTLENLKNTKVIWGNRGNPKLDKWEAERWPSGRPFSRLGLTLSKKGWTSSVQWDGTTGARGTGKTIEEAIANSIKTAEREWGVEVVEKI